MDVIGVFVDAVVVVTDDGDGVFLGDDVGDLAGDDVELDIDEGAEWAIADIAIDAGVHVVEEHEAIGAEQFAGSLCLGASDVAQRRLAEPVGDLAELAGGGDDDDGAHAGRGECGDGAAGEDRLVVGVRVHEDHRVGAVRVHGCESVKVDHNNQDSTPGLRRSPWPIVCALVDVAVEALQALLPALLFLLAAVPFSDLMGRLGFFDALSELVLHRSRNGVPVWLLWTIAGVTTIGLNLDTTIVLLTPTYWRLARRSDADPVAVALIPLLLAAFTSSVLPVSNLTTLIAVERTGASLGEVVGALAIPSLAAAVVGWLAFARRHAVRLEAMPQHRLRHVDQRALRIGALIVSFVLVGFVAGESFGVPAWCVLVAADIALVAVVRHVPWRSLPIVAALQVAIAGVVVALVVPDSVGQWVASRQGASGAIVAALGGSLSANVVNNLPATLAGLGDGATISPGTWGWLLGVNAGAAFLPIASLANILWLRIVGEHGASVPWRRYVAMVVPVAAPAFVAAVAALGIMNYS